MIQDEGPGWRLAWDPLRGKFPVLVGGDNWAFELSKSEWRNLVLVVFDLIDQHEKLVDRLMPGELISLEIEREGWWACIDGDRSSWDLKVLLEGDRDLVRGIEGSWPIPAAQSMVEAMRSMWDSCN